MSSSTSALRRRGSRVLRDTDAPVQPTASPDVFDLDLAPAGLVRLNPARIDAAVEEGRTAGYQDGYAAGHQAGLDAARAAQAELTTAYEARLRSLVQASEAAVADALSGVGAVADAAARVTAGAAFALAEAIVGRELALATEPGRDAVARALAIAPDSVELQLRLNPDDAAAFDATSLPPGRVITVVADHSVASGDCLAESGWTRVDARIETALERVRAVLEGTP
jgi:flagellar assembly protein FliH